MQQDSTLTLGAQFNEPNNIFDSASPDYMTVEGTRKENISGLSKTLLLAEESAGKRNFWIPLIYLTILIPYVKIRKGS